jgi:hypothetical protein
MTHARAVKAMTDDDLATVRRLAEPIIPPGTVSLNTVKLDDAFEQSFARSDWFPLVVAELDRLRSSLARLEKREGELQAEVERLRVVESDKETIAGWYANLLEAYARLRSEAAK